MGSYVWLIGDHKKRTQVYRGCWVGWGVQRDDMMRVDVDLATG